ncbi:MAG TPA: metallophosphoesterase family protein [Polyangiaceae bacterium]|nr:metallophosphoesterase family protein [Polyangiaceae bacterium]
MLERFGLLGDVHAEDVALATALEHFARVGVDAVLCVGDVVDGRGDLERCRELLEGHRVACVAGNHERWLLGGTMRSLADAHRAERLTAATRAFLASLPPTREFETPAGRLLLCHGVGDDDMAQLRPYDEGYALANNAALARLRAAGRYRFAVGGHTHRRMARRFGDLCFVNPGTLFREHEPGFATLDLGAGAVQFFEWRAPGGAPTPLEPLPLP